MKEYLINGFVFKEKTVNSSGIWMEVDGRTIIWVDIEDGHARIASDFEKKVEYIPEEVKEIFLREVEKNFS